MNNVQLLGMLLALWIKYKDNPVGVLLHSWPTILVGGVSAGVLNKKCISTDVRITWFCSYLAGLIFPMLLTKTQLKVLTP